MKKLILHCEYYELHNRKNSNLGDCTMVCVPGVTSMSRPSMQPVVGLRRSCRDGEIHFVDDVGYASSNFEDESTIQLCQIYVENVRWKSV